ncbi:MAG: 6-phospho-beta-glucosidase [Clostridia bacterium]|nr:6-phospho-beta-glucosidase [Clostridia bacterium]
MKFTIVGAGSSYTPELIEEMIVRREMLPVEELVLYDIDEKRLEIMGGFCRRFADKRGMQGLKIRTTTNLDDALEGADFVDTQIRVGGNRQRVKDEKIPLKYGLIGQETTGAGGMMKAFRTIPVMMEVARHMEKVSPDGWLINYTNPTGLVTEAVTRYTKANIAGFCSGGIFPKMWAERSLGISYTGKDYNRVQYDYIGLNHMNFISNITIDGRPITDAEFMALAKENGHDVDPELSRLLGVLTSPYLQYYYHTSAKIEKLRSQPQTRGEYVQSLEKEIFDGYADPNNADKPAALAKRGGGGYSEVAMNFVNAVYNNTDTEQVVNVPNNGAIPFLPNSAVVEINCMVNRRGMQPIHKSIDKIPSMCWGLIAAVKNYEQLAVEAAVEGSIRKMKWALLAHPLVREYELVEALVPELLEANRDYLPQFHL